MSTPSVDGSYQPQSGTAEALFAKSLNSCGSVHTDTTPASSISPSVLPQVSELQSTIAATLAGVPKAKLTDVSSSESDTDKHDDDGKEEEEEEEEEAVEETAAAVAAASAQATAASALATTRKWGKHVMYLLYSLLTLVWEVAAGVLGVPITRPEYKALEGQLAKAQSYAEWRVIGRMLDDLDGFAEWRTEEASIYFNFDGVMRCMQDLAEMKRSGHTSALIEVMLSRVHRSLYGVNNTQLYQFRTGTKNIIHSYTSLVCYLISELASTAGAAEAGEVHRMLQDSPVRLRVSTPPVPTGTGLSLQQRYDALTQMQVVYGATALVLNGGMICAPLHLGVAKALYSAGLLPQVVYGYRSGAIVAALVCCAVDVGTLEEHQLNFSALAGKDHGGTMMRRWRRLRRQGHLMDSTVLMRFLRDNLGELTFMEAYRRTGRVLNIQYTAFSRNKETGRTQCSSRLLNYLTAPNVLVYSAAVCSMTSVPVMFPRSPLLARNPLGVVVEYDPAVLIRSYTQRMSDDQHSAPMNSLHRLRELFHVQYFIISECSTVLKPSFLRRRIPAGPRQMLLGWLHFLATAVLQLVWLLLCTTPLEPYLVSAIDNDMAECDVVGDAMVIFPHVSWRDWRQLWGSLSRKDIARCLTQCERQVWPRLEEVRMSQAVEQTIASTLHTLGENHPFASKT